ncbi:hypothetical protein DFH06DRAFT_1149353 [Mycena polygramma]|nr:hypothetical protein DFH06DRAFT_1149353 [Mycena polygramma]
MADRRKRTPASTSSLSLRYSILTTSPDSKSKSTSASQTQNVVDAPSRKRKSENNQEEGHAKKKQSTDDATRPDEVLRERRNARKTVDIMQRDSERIQMNPTVPRRNAIPEDVPVNDRAPPAPKRTYDRRPSVPDRPLTLTGVAPRRDLAPPNSGVAAPRSDAGLQHQLPVPRMPDVLRARADGEGSCFKPDTAGRAPFPPNDRDAVINKSFVGQRASEPITYANNRGAPQYRWVHPSNAAINDGRAPFATNDRDAGISKSSVDQRALGDDARRDLAHEDEPMPDVNKDGVSNYRWGRGFNDVRETMNDQGRAPFATNDRDTGISKSSVDQRASGDDARLLEYDEDELMPREDDGLDDIVGGATYDDEGNGTSDEYIDEQADEDEDEDDQQDIMSDNLDDDNTGAPSLTRTQACRPREESVPGTELGRARPSIFGAAPAAPVRTRRRVTPSRNPSQPESFPEQEPQYKERYQQVEEAVNGGREKPRDGQDRRREEDTSRGPQNERRGQDRRQDDSGRGDRGDPRGGQRKSAGKQPQKGRDVVDDYRKKNKAVRPPDPAKLAQCRRAQEPCNDDDDDDDADDDDADDDDADDEEELVEEDEDSGRTRRKRTSRNTAPGPDLKGYYEAFGGGWTRFIEMAQIRMQLYLVKIHWLPTKQQVKAIAGELLSETFARYNDMEPDFPLDLAFFKKHLPHFQKMMWVETSHYRSDAKTAGREIVKKHYPLELTDDELKRLQSGGSNQEEALNIVAKRVAELTAESKYLRRQPTDKDRSSCNFGHPALKAMIHALIWNKPQARRDCLGTMFPEEFKTFDQHRLICAGASVLLHALDEHSTGQFERGTYSAPHYVKHYNSILLGLRRLMTDPAHHQKTLDEWAFWHWQSFEKDGKKSDANAGRADLCDVVFD